jgi:hypothetical protein
MVDEGQDQPSLVLLWCVTVKRYHIMLYRVHPAICRIRIHNISGDRY